MSRSLRFPLFSATLTFVLLAGMAGAQPSLELTPAPGAKVQEQRPCIQISWPAGTVAGSKARLWFNGYEVSQDCLRNDQFVSYRPFAAPSSGPVQVRFEAEDDHGQPLEKSWSFDLQQPRLIQKVSHNGAQEGLYENDDFVIRCQACAGGKAHFEVPGWQPVPMKEIQPGIYEASYRVRSCDTALKQPVKVVYEFDGHREEQVALEPVKIFGGFYRVKVLSPADGSNVDQSFTIVGRAKPGSTVSIIPKLGFGSDGRAPTTMSNAVSATAGAIPAEVDKDGNFKVDYGVPLLLPGMGLVMSVYSVDEEGTRSMATVVRYNFK